MYFILMLGKGIRRITLL